ncbi:MAG: hypothetical protein ACK5LT_08150 [Lachnospirales bacterium]
MSLKDSLFKLIIIGIVFSVGFIVIVGLTGFLEEHKNSDIVQIQDTLDSTLIQVYALEGNYPSDLYYLENYGVAFNLDKYNYEYEFIGYNIKPTVIVSKVQK